MVIDDNTAVLVVAAIADTPNDDGRYWAEFYPIDRLLELRKTPDMLRGHPILDIAHGEIPDVCAEYLRPGLARRLTRWTKAGRFIAVKRNPRRKGGITFSWRRGEDYLTDEDRFWLMMISESAEIVVSEARATQALAAVFRGLYPAAERLAKRNRRTLRRDRKRERRRQRKEPYDSI